MTTGARFCVTGTFVAVALLAFGQVSAARQEADARGETETETVPAEGEQQSPDIAELERRLDVLAEEVERPPVRSRLDRQVTRTA